MGASVSGSHSFVAGRTGGAQLGILPDRKMPPAFWPRFGFRAKVERCSGGAPVSMAEKAMGACVSGSHGFVAGRGFEPPTSGL